MQPIIDITLAQTSRIAVSFGMGFGLLLLLVILTAPISLLGKWIVLMLFIGAALLMLFWSRQAYRLRFYGNCWLIDELPASGSRSHSQLRGQSHRHPRTQNDTFYSYDMMLTAMHALPFCKQLVFSCDAYKPLSLLVFQDQVTVDTWRKLCVLSNFKQFGNKFY